MPSAKDIFVKCDELESLPEPNRRNYLFELERLGQILPKDSRVLQVGSMDGLRVIKLLQVRPDLTLTGLDIEPELVDLARRNVADANLAATFVLGDITAPPAMPQFDWVICLNHTLGYIPDQDKAVHEMRRLGRHVAISVFGEKFNKQLARDYFSAIGLDDYGSVKRYTRRDIGAWGGQITETPIGYFVVAP